MITCTVDDMTVLLEEIHLGMYRIVQETLNNIVKHSEATEAYVKLTTRDGQLILQIHDNGYGFDVEKQSAGFGLDGIRERTAMMGSVLNISSGKDTGTDLQASLPIPRALSIDF